MTGWATMQREDTAMVMEYEGYVGHVEYDPDDNVLHDRVVNIRDGVTFQGRTVDELRQTFADSITDYRAMCAEDGVAPSTPRSGKFLVRVDPALHREISLAAARAGMSVNAFVRETLANRMHT